MPTGELIYFVAAVVILYNVDEQTQRHYVGHTDDIKWSVDSSLDQSQVLLVQVIVHDSQSPVTSKFSSFLGLWYTVQVLCQSYWYQNLVPETWKQ